MSETSIEHRFVLEITPLELAFLQSAMMVAAPTTRTVGWSTILSEHYKARLGCEGLLALFEKLQSLDQAMTEKGVAR